MKTKKLRKDQRGFTIIELLMFIALTGIITAAITTTVFQVFNMNTRTANHMIAVSQVQQAGKLVSEDMLEAQADMIDDSPGGGEFLILGWIGENSTVVHEVIYTLDDSELWRSESIDGGERTETRVAEYINPDPTKTSCDCSCDNCDCDDLVLTFTVTATVGEESETRIYRVQPRPGS
jgi:type II secretory pathway pseudopilin PulG